MRVFGLGQCSLDYIAVVRKYPEEDTKEEALELTVQGGGPVATALVSLSRLGAKTTFAGMVSDDDAGVKIIKGLKHEGVDTRGLKIKKGGSSQTAFIIVSRKGLRTIIWKRPGVPEFAPEDIKASLIKGADLVLLDGLMMKASLKAAATSSLPRISPRGLG
jgi:sulfofructose kinase